VSDRDIDVEIIQSLTRLRVYEEAQKAFDLGEIEIWLEWQNSKTIDEWDEWNKKYSHEEMKARYGRLG